MKMPANQGVSSGRGFTYQYAYACSWFVHLFRKRTLVSVTLEGEEDIDLVEMDKVRRIRELVQVKTREEGGDNCAIRNLASLVLCSFFMRRRPIRSSSVCISSLMAIRMPG